MAAEFAGAHYHDLPLGCRRCARAFVFSAGQQRESFEVRKRHVWQRPLLCPACWSLCLGLKAELKVLRSRWNSQRAAVKRDIDALRRWLQLLDQLSECAMRRDTAQIAMLKGLLTRAG